MTPSPENFRGNFPGDWGPGPEKSGRSRRSPFRLERRPLHLFASVPAFCDAGTSSPRTRGNHCSDRAAAPIDAWISESDDRSSRRSPGGRRFAGGSRLIRRTRPGPSKGRRARKRKRRLELPSWIGGTAATGNASGRGDSWLLPGKWSGGLVFAYRGRRLVNNGGIVQERGSYRMGCAKMGSSRMFLRF